MCKIFKVEGRAFMFWKMHGEGRTIGIDDSLALEKLVEGLRSENNTYIYHCYDHYCCPVGFEATPSRPADAYKLNEEIDK